MTEFRRSCPGSYALRMWFTQGMEPDLTLLHGEVLVSGEQLEAFSAASLPSRPAERFGVLFAHRQQWAAEDLKPYIAGLEVRAGTCQHANALISQRLSRTFAKPLLQNILTLLAGTRPIYRVFAAEIHTCHTA